MTSFLINPYRFTAAGDPYFSSVSLLLHGDGTNGSTTITDSSGSPKTVTAFGNAQISTAQSKFGGASIAFDGNGDYLTVGANSALSFGSNPFTIETFAYFSSSANMALYDTLPIGGAGGRNSGFVLIKDNTNRLNVFSAGGFQGVSSISAPIGQWCYIALTKSGSTWSYQIDNQPAGSFTYAFSPTDNNATIGRLGDGADYYINGYLDECRVTNGVARDVSTVPTAPFPDS
jgi:hypothetical protein